MCLIKTTLTVCVIGRLHNIWSQTTEARTSSTSRGSLFDSKNKYKIIKRRCKSWIMWWRNLSSMKLDQDPRKSGHQVSIAAKVQRHKSKGRHPRDQSKLSNRIKWQSIWTYDLAKWFNLQERMKKDSLVRYLNSFLRHKHLVLSVHIMDSRRQALKERSTDS